jgi:hypothetical protein
MALPANSRGPDHDSLPTVTLLTAALPNLPPLNGPRPPSNMGASPAPISVVIIVAITAVETQLDKTFDAVKNALSGANN